jgi:hypothetical protein
MKNNANESIAIVPRLHTRPLAIAKTCCDKTTRNCTAYCACESALFPQALVSWSLRDHLQVVWVVAWSTMAVSDSTCQQRSWETL